MNWFLTWAQGKALTGTNNFQGDVTRQLLFGGIVHSFLHIQKEPSLNPDDRAVVEAWIDQVGTIIKAQYSVEGPYGTALNISVSNLMYMAGENGCGSVSNLMDLAVKRKCGNEL